MKYVHIIYKYTVFGGSKLKTVAVHKGQKHLFYEIRVFLLGFS